MGYDMYLVNEVECPDKEAAQVEWDTAIAARNALERPDLTAYKESIDPWDTNTWPDSEYKTAQLRVEAAMDRRSKADLNYFRLNIHGMGRAREIMQRLGMVYDAERPASAKFPNWHVDEHEPWDCEAENCPVPSGSNTCAQYREQRDKVLRWAPLDQEGILVEKLCSNDGWIVLPTECTQALEIWAKHTAEIRAAVIKAAPWWPGWLDFIRRASTNGGFKVY